MKVRVHQAVWRRGHQTGVLFGRANGRDVFVLDDVFWILDMEARLEEAGGPVDAYYDDHKVVELPK